MLTYLLIGECVSNDLMHLFTVLFQHHLLSGQQRLHGDRQTLSIEGELVKLHLLAEPPSHASLLANECVSSLVEAHLVPQRLGDAHQVLNLQLRVPVLGLFLQLIALPLEAYSDKSTVLCMNTIHCVMNEHIAGLQV